MNSRLATFFVSHGGGPWPWIKDMLPGDWSTLEASLEDIPRQVGRTPRAILSVSAHWEAPEFTVQTSPRPPMLYDYGGFPDFTYRIQYPAPGSPEVAARVVELLDGAGIPVRSDERRGYDHGTFVPLHVAYPAADVPVLQLSIRSGYDPEEHLAVGRALAPLRDEDVLIIGSGLSFHNMRGFGPAGREPSRAFDAWLNETMVGDPRERSERLRRWAEAPGARASHPSEDHLIPLMVVVGAAEDEPAANVYHDDAVMGWVTASSFRVGTVLEGAEAAAV